MCCLSFVLLDNLIQCVAILAEGEHRFSCPVISYEASEDSFSLAVQRLTSAANFDLAQQTKVDRSHRLVHPGRGGSEQLISGDGRNLF
jgi:hypothetical protein